MQRGHLKLLLVSAHLACSIGCRSDEVSVYEGFLREHLGDKPGCVRVSLELPWPWRDGDEDTTWSSLHEHLDALQLSTYEDFRANSNNPWWQPVGGTFPRGRGTLWLSGIGMSTDGQQALLYCGHQRGPLDGHGGFYLLARVRGQWRIVDEYITWIS